MKSRYSRANVEDTVEIQCPSDCSLVLVFIVGTRFQAYHSSPPSCFVGMTECYSLDLPFDRVEYYARKVLELLKANKVSKLIPSNDNSLKQLMEFIESSVNEPNLLCCQMPIFDFEKTATKLNEAFDVSMLEQRIQIESEIEAELKKKGISLKKANVTSEKLKDALRTKS